MSLTRTPFLFSAKNESIQPQVPLRLPCYDFAPVIQMILDLLPGECKTFKFSLKITKILDSKGWKVFWPLELPERDGRGVQGPGTNSPWRADPRLLVIPTSCSRVAESNLNYDRFLGFTPTRIIVAHCTYHCNTCVAQPIRVMKTWRHPHLPPVYHWQFEKRRESVLGFWITFHEGYAR